MENSLNVALKEWSVVCDALLAGQQAILLRKGGIYEAAGEFELEHSRFALFPTLLHQKAQSVKPAWRDAIKIVDREPEHINIRGWAEVFWIGRVPGRAAFDALDDLHLWDKPLIDMRFNYRPDYPLYVMVLRTFVLAQAMNLPLDDQYAGCKSWVPLRENISLSGSQAVMADPALLAIQNRIMTTFVSACP
jgi:hypothetical protein